MGHSTLPDSTAAGREAATTALAGRAAKLLVVFASDRHVLQPLLDAINATSGDAPLIGCSTAGEIATGGPGDAGVVIFAIGGDGFTVHTHAAEHASCDLRGAGATAASRVADLGDRPHRVLLLLTDALAGDQQEIVRGTYATVGAAVPLVGGCAGDDLKMEVTYQLHGRRVLRDAVVTAAIGSDAPFEIGVRHGWTPFDTPMMVTRSQGHIVDELDGRPALDVYLERLDAPDEALPAADMTLLLATGPTWLRPAFVSSDV